MAMIIEERRAVKSSREGSVITTAVLPGCYLFLPLHSTASTSFYFFSPWLSDRATNQSTTGEILRIIPPQKRSSLYEMGNVKIIAATYGWKGTMIATGITVIEAKEDSIVILNILMIAIGLGTMILKVQINNQWNILHYPRVKGAAEAREQQYSVLQIRCCTIVGDRLTDMNPSPLSFKFNKVARKFSRYWGLLSVCRLHTFLAPNHFSSSPAHEDCMFVQ
ncbi:uncharacterized protein [Oryza sativa Japonica Group]|uniref:uncharacterized protein isoform X2 n=1 Tax=Oryza sativa subsp. japonica TaxID=39947 RepID=UPI00339C50F3